MSSKETGHDREASLKYDGNKITTGQVGTRAGVTIENECIIGFLPQHGHATEQTLLYVDVDEPNTDSRDGEQGDKGAVPAEQRTFLRSMKIKEPPHDFKKDFSPNTQSWLFRSNAGGSRDEPHRASDIDKGHQRITIIISTHSGSHSAESVFTNLLEPFMRAVVGSSDTYTVIRTSSADTITEYTQSTILPIARQGYQQSIIILSGDGGAVDILNALLSSNESASNKDDTTESTYTPPTIALLPLGTGNALANSTHIASDFTLGLSTLLRGTPTPLPLFRATLPKGSYPLDAHANPTAAPSTEKLPVHGAVVFSWALHASLVADSDTEEYRKHGASRFKMAGKENLFPNDGKESPHVYRGDVKAVVSPSKGAREIDLGSEHAYLVVTLVSNLEKTFCISPQSKSMDGKLRIVRLPPMEDGGKGVMKVMEMAYQDGKHVGMDQVAYEEVEAVTLKIDETEERWRRVCVDGKIYVVGEEGEVDVRRRVEGEVVKLVVLGR